MSKISTDIDRLLPARVQNVELYDPLRDPIIYDLSDNTSQWGMAPGVVEKIASLMQKSSQNNYSFSRYPDIYARSLKIALAKKYCLSESPIEQIVVGCGTDDVLDCTVKRFRTRTTQSWRLYRRFLWQVILLGLMDAKSDNRVKFGWKYRC